MIWPCPPDFLPYLVGVLFGLFVGIPLGAWLHGFVVTIIPGGHSQFRLDGSAVDPDTTGPA